MQSVLIDTFIVPEESRMSVLERTRGVQTFRKTLRGFVEGCVYEKKAGASRDSIITTAVWESEEALENAQKVVAAEYQRQHFNPQEFMKQWKVEIKQPVFERFPNYLEEGVVSPPSPSKCWKETA